MDKMQRICLNRSAIINWYAIALQFGNEIVQSLFKRPVQYKSKAAIGVVFANVINNIPFANLKVENSLTDFISARAVDGMYLLVAQEEEKIRKDVNFRKTDLMKRVFGYADEQLRLRSTGGKSN